MPWSFLYRKDARRTGLVAVAVAVISVSPGVEARERACIAVSVSSPQAAESTRSRRFSATKILDLELHVVFPRSLEGEHRVDVKVYTPDRQLYQVLTVPFHVGDDETDAAPRTVARRHRRKLADLPTPLDEADARETPIGRRLFRRVSVTLPVAGTSIVASSLYGKWTAVAFLDGSAEACGIPARFVITE
jgi:hypothetical protein